MNKAKPFAESFYRLSRCQLRRLQGEEKAALIGAQLAGMDPWKRLAYPAAELSRYLLWPDPALHRYTVLTRDETLAGVISVRYPWLRGPYLELIGLIPDFQGAGLGSELIGWFEQQARLVADNAWVIVSAFNHKAYDFYRRHGFVEVGVIKELVRPGYDEILLRKVVKEIIQR
jgi:ribosomal protein S18 acetylase RimI-like enzyme